MTKSARRAKGGVLLNFVFGGIGGVTALRSKKPQHNTTRIITPLNFVVIFLKHIDRLMDMKKVRDTNGMNPSDREI